MGVCSQVSVSRRGSLSHSKPAMTRKSKRHVFCFFLPQQHDCTTSSKMQAVGIFLSTILLNMLKTRHISLGVKDAALLSVYKHTNHGTMLTCDPSLSQPI